MGVDQDVIQGTAFHTWKKHKYRFVENKALINLPAVKRYQMYHFIYFTALD